MRHMRGVLCRKQTCRWRCTVTVIHYCTDDRQLLIAHCSRHRSIASCMFVQNRDLCLPHLYSTPPLEWVPVGMLPWRLIRKIVWLPKDEIIGRYDYSFWQNSFTNVTDGRTDGRTDTAWWHRPLLRSIARQKWTKCKKTDMPCLLVCNFWRQSARYWLNDTVLKLLGLTVFKMPDRGARLEICDTSVKLSAVDQI